MKLLIVDDEELTRKGMISAIDWASLNIHQICEADDGMHGLETALLEKPDIILSDIRMPRLTGIEMAERIREALPDTSVIFMSGYSDKEYLKAAIKLKAVSYVEKPIDPIEIEEAVLEAIENNEQLKRAKQSAHLHSLAKAGHLALAMTYTPPPDQKNVFSPEALKQTGCHITTTMFYTTLIIKFTKSLGDISDEKLQDIHDSFSALLAHYHLDVLHIIKHDQYLVYHIFGDNKPSERILVRISEFLKEQFLHTAPFFIAVGTTVSGIENTYKSYNSAVILLQSSFFYDYNSILSQKDLVSSHSPAFTDPTTTYAQALASKNTEYITKTEHDIYALFKNSHSLMPNLVKDVYYKLFMTIQNTYKNLSLNASGTFPSSDIILEYVQNCHTLTELHHLLIDKSLSFIRSLAAQTPENPTILLIKNFIGNNYQRENLSVKEISEHIHMSSSYACTLFKAETDVTLNQYITEYRIEKAKVLLADSNYKITDISAKIGYADGNYFGKIFKKQVGLSPSEYREKMLL